MKCLDDLNDNLTVEAYLVDAKKHLHEYLRYIPWDHTGSARATNKYLKRRKMRRME